MQRTTKPVYGMRMQRHLTRLQDVCDDIEKATNRVLPTGPAQFGHVAVMGITWSSDTMGCKSAERRLFKIFKDHYNFFCHPFVINHQSHTAQSDLAYEMVEFQRKHDSDDALLIYVYSGHAEASWNGSMKWGGELNALGRLRPPFIDWHTIWGLPGSGRGRVLFIFDTCFAGAGGLYDGPELLGAAGWSTEAASNPQYSFTRILTDKLAELKGKSRTVSQVYTEICRDILASQLDPHAIHFLKCEEDSIVLEKTPATSHAFGMKGMQARNAALQQLGPTRYKVLVEVHLRGEVPSLDLEQWNKWLATKLPRLVSHIKIQAAYAGQSQYLHMSMPLEVWDGLPHEQPAYRFLNFVSSDNIIPSLSQSKFTLTDRTKTDNIPFAGSSTGVYK